MKKYMYKLSLSLSLSLFLSFFVFLSLSPSRSLIFSTRHLIGTQIPSFHLVSLLSLFLTQGVLDLHWNFSFLHHPTLKSSTNGGGRKRGSEDSVEGSDDKEGMVEAQGDSVKATTGEA